MSCSEPALWTVITAVWSTGALWSADPLTETLLTSALTATLKGLPINILKIVLKI